MTLSLVDRKGSHDFQQMSSMQAKRFGRRCAIALGGGERGNDQLAPVGIDGVVIGQFFNLVTRLPADDPDRKMMDCQISGRPLKQLPVR